MIGNSSALHSVIWGLIIGGSGIGVGGLAAYFLLYIHRVILPLLIISAVGMIFTLVVFEILPESILLGGAFFTFMGITIGFIMAKQMDRLTHQIIIITNDPRKDSYIRSGIILTFAIALHNFPSGIALGTSLVSTPELAKALSTTMLVHAIPEGIALGIPFVLSKISPFAIIMTALFIALPTGIGTFIGYMFGTLFPIILSLMLGLSIGTILYVTYFEILKPEWKKAQALHGFLGLLFGICLGAFYIFFL